MCHLKGGESMTISNKSYDILMYIAQIVLPAVAVFVGTVAEPFGVSNGPEIAVVIIAVDTLLGALLQGLKNSYNAEE